MFQLPDELANVSLARQGLLGASPTQPTVAIRFQCLELYHQLRRRQSSLSTQSMTKVLCALHNVSFPLRFATNPYLLIQVTYQQTLRDQFAIAFDIYLQILRRVQQMVDHSLSRDIPDWHLKFGCPLCGHSVEGEPALVPARMHAQDGGNSPKRLDRSGHADPRRFDSKFFMTPEEVDAFKDEVAHSNKKDPECTSEYKVANTIDNPAALDAFDQTGIFLVTCRHHIVEKITEMKKSGEL